MSREPKLWRRKTRRFWFGLGMLLFLCVFVAAISLRGVHLDVKAPDRLLSDESVSYTASLEFGCLIASRYELRLPSKVGQLEWDLAVRTSTGAGFRLLPELTGENDPLLSYWILSLPAWPLTFLWAGLWLIRTQLARRRDAKCLESTSGRLT